MIFDIVARSLTSKRVLMPTEQLLGNCAGSRMPEVQPKLLTKALAQAAVDACPTSALQLESREGNTHLIMNYGECTGCGQCVEVSQGAFVVAESLACCGVSQGWLDPAVGCRQRN